ncbi:MAG: hypothetical protein Q8L68_01820 [Methylococcales bacterium]|nr:hypothetical protein [Methylococcales bacterium]
MVQFVADRKHFLRSLQGIKSLINEYKKRNFVIECELTATSTILTLILYGVEFSIPCKGTGAASATFPLIPFLEIMKLENKENIEMKISDSHVTLGTFSFPAQIRLFPNDRILRSIKLPKKYSLIDLIELTKLDYTQEELDYNQIPQKIIAMEDGVSEAIKSCYNKLKKFGIQFNEVEEFVMTTVYK